LRFAVRFFLDMFFVFQSSVFLGWTCSLFPPVDKVCISTGDMVCISTVVGEQKERWGRLSLVTEARLDPKYRGRTQRDLCPGRSKAAVRNAFGRAIAFALNFFLARAVRGGSLFRCARAPIRRALHFVFSWLAPCEGKASFAARERRIGALRAPIRRGRPPQPSGRNSLAPSDFCCFCYGT
jgi:hypothetical protein